MNDPCERFDPMGRDFEMFRNVAQPNLRIVVIDLRSEFNGDNPDDGSSAMLLPVPTLEDIAA